MARPDESQFPPYFSRYIVKVNADSLSEAVETYARSLGDFFKNLPEEKADHRYAPDKWTVKEMLQHIIDAERIFSYRLLRIARKDKTPLASFDENTYAETSNAGERSFKDIKEEFLALRKSTDLLITSIKEEQLAEKGIASNLPVTANAVGYIIFGHMLHHKQILEERYL